MHPFDPQTFAREWAAAWNRRNLDTVLAHFSEDITFSTPTAVDTIGWATVHGKAALRAYWEAALQRITVLHFVVIRTVWDGARRELGIIYDRRINGREDRALELLAFTPEGRVIAGEVFHGVRPVSPRG